MKRHWRRKLVTAKGNAERWKDEKGREKEKSDALFGKMNSLYLLTCLSCLLCFALLLLAIVCLFP
jgi:hypothetical protein